MNRHLLLIGVLFILNCSSGAPAATASPSPKETTVTLTLSDSGCAYEGPSQIPAGELSITTVNKTQDRFFADLSLITQGHSFEDFRAVIAADAARIKKGQGPNGPPSWLAQATSHEFGPAETGSLKANVAAGRYVSACGRIRAGSPIGIWVGAEITVTLSAQRQGIRYRTENRRVTAFRADVRHYSPAAFRSS